MPRVAGSTVKHKKAAPKKRALQVAVARAPISLGGYGDYRKRSFRGRGDYNEHLAKASNSDLVGEGMRRIGTKIAKMVGFGDYAMPSFNVQHNSIMAQLGQANTPPSMQSTTNRSHIIRHREYLGDVFTSTTAGAFKIQSYALNPGLVQTFPWLAALSQNFEQYRINGMVWEFKSTSADALNSTNTALGTVIMATEYNASTPASQAFSSKQQMENHEFAASARQSCSMLHPIECMKSQTPISELFIRSGPVPAGQDAKTYDLGVFYIATVGSQGANVNIGELWVTYEVEFFKPQLESIFGLDVLTDNWTLGTGVSVVNWWGNSQTLKSQSSLGTSLLVTGGNGQIIFPNYVANGMYSITYYVAGTANATSLPTVTYTNCAPANIIAGGNILSNPAAGQTAFLVEYFITITGPNAIFQFNTSTGSLPAPTASGYLVIQQMNGNQN